MAVLFETMKGIFFMMTVVYGLLLLKGDAIFAEQTVGILSKIFMPGYLVFCGIILGYVVSLGLVKKSDPLELQGKAYVRSFLIGSFLGIALALVSIFTM